MAIADFDVADFDGSKKEMLDSQLLVKFFYKTRQDFAESKKQGRPIFKEVEYIDIKVPGDRNCCVCRPARDADRTRFPKHYEAFKNRTAAPETGTPLAEWAKIPRSAVEQLAFANVKTVEQLAALSDTYTGQIHGGNSYKRMAQEYLKRVEEEKAVGDVSALKEENEDLKAKLEELMKKVDDLTKKKKKKPTRKKKAEKKEE
jgi:hypothetical protein